jgi:hypothetical protein
MGVRSRFAAGILALATSGACSLAGFGGVADAVAPSPSGAPSGACLVAPSGSESCYGSVASMQAVARSLTPRFGQSSCEVTLYSGADYTGAALGITIAGEWVNLANYGWADVAVSFTSEGCTFHLAQLPNGVGYWFPGYTGPGGSSPDMGPGWDYTVQSVYLE